MVLENDQLDWGKDLFQANFQEESVVLLAISRQRNRIRENRDKDQLEVSAAISKLLNMFDSQGSEAGNLETHRVTVFRIFDISYENKGDLFGVWLSNLIH